MRKLRKVALGVLVYSDEGQQARYSMPLIKKAAARASEVLVLRPGVSGDQVVTARRGQRRFRFRVVGEPVRLGHSSRKADTLRWTWTKLEEIARLTDRNRRISASTIDLRTERMPMRVPHRVTATIGITYPSTEMAVELEKKIRAILGKTGPKWELELLTDRPPFVKRGGTDAMVDEFMAVAEQWQLPLKADSSIWPSVAGLLAADQPALCGLGPVARDLRTPQEAVLRISLVQRTLLLAGWLASRVGK